MYFSESKTFWNIFLLPDSLHYHGEGAWTTRSYVVGGLMLLVWSPEVAVQSKDKEHYSSDKEHYTRAVHTARIDLTHSGTRHGVGAHSGGQGFAHGTRSGAA